MGIFFFKNNRLILQLCGQLSVRDEVMRQF